jgi:hypothetical protein
MDGETLRADVGRFVAAVCCTAGGLVGLWQGMLAAPLSPTGAEVFTALAEVLAPVAWRVLVGVLIGVVVSWLLCAVVPGLRAPRPLSK